MKQTELLQPEQRRPSKTYLTNELRQAVINLARSRAGGIDQERCG